MARHATILLAGTLIATALLPAVATSQSFQQSSAQNQQDQSGDISAPDQTLHVVTADQTTVTTTATGNSYSAQVQSGSLDVQSVQTNTGNIAASRTLTVDQATAATAMTTAATGNVAETDSLGYADLTGSVRQTTGAVSIDAESQINAASAVADSVTHNVQAVGNSLNVGVIGGSATLDVNQSSQATVQANGGAVMEYTGQGDAVFTSVATGNNLTATATSGTTTALTLNQSNDGLIQATHFVSAGNGQSLTGTSSAIANNVSITNENNPLGVTSNQGNTAYVRGQTVVSAYEFGSGAANATGVGNSLTAGNPGGDMTLNTTQTNAGGGVEVISSFSGTGGTGYDASSSATAIGNAVTGYACSTCKTKMTVTNHQTNSTDVAASSSVTMSGANRSVTAVSTAVGNTATFYVSEPDN